MKIFWSNHCIENNLCKQLLFTRLMFTYDVVMLLCYVVQKLCSISRPSNIFALIQGPGHKFQRKYLNFNKLLNEITRKNKRKKEIKRD